MALEPRMKLNGQDEVALAKKQQDLADQVASLEELDTSLDDDSDLESDELDPDLEELGLFDGIKKLPGKAVGKIGSTIKKGIGRVLPDAPHLPTPGDVARSGAKKAGKALITDVPVPGPTSRKKDSEKKPWDDAVKNSQPAPNSHPRGPGGSFDEKEHPRDGNGKFTDAGSSKAQQTDAKAYKQAFDKWADKRDKFDQQQKAKKKNAADAIYDQADARLAIADRYKEQADTAAAAKNTKRAAGLKKKSAAEAAKADDLRKKGDAIIDRRLPEYNVPRPRKPGDPVPAPKTKPRVVRKSN